MTAYYKYLNADGTTPLGYGQWPEPGVWLPDVEGTLKPCVRGYHAMRTCDLVHWSGEELWRVELGDEVVVSDTKVIARRARRTEQITRWNRATWTEYACLCGERVLHLYEGDKAPLIECYAAARAAIAADFDDASVGHCRIAARAAWDAARAAEAAGAAWDAARAAWAAGAAWDAERQWQTQTLCDLLGIGNDSAA